MTVSLLLLCGCAQSPNDDADRLHTMLRDCYDTLQYHPHPVDCDRAQALLGTVDLSQVDAWKVVKIQMDIAAINERTAGNK